MCGIAGLIAKNEKGRQWMPYMSAAAGALRQRGPDAQHFFADELVSFGHCRLSIIDLSAAADQPMTDESGRFTIIYNGEIFNYRALREQLRAEGCQFRTQSDTEVLLHLYKKHGQAMLQQLNGFFAFAIYDQKEQSCFIARDRFGVKPMLYYEDENCLLFASEIKALLQFPLQRTIDTVAMQEYLQLNFIPAPDTIFSSVKKLLPGHFLYWHNNQVTLQRYYSIPSSKHHTPSKTDYATKQKELVDLLDDAVRLRLISDVPLGAFLSGGLDSSVVCGLAARHTNKMMTFSIGYREDGFFDETNYAKAVARHFNTDHTVFSVTRSQLYEILFDVLDYFDEPFADSSALPVFMLSRLTHQEVKVALSGDGADELFGGYIKHSAEYRARHAGLAELAIASAYPLLKLLSSSRNSPIMNRVRQLQRFAEGMKLNAQDRYWRWCSIAGYEESKALLLQDGDEVAFMKRKRSLIQNIQADGDMNDVLLNDIQLVLANDMLYKVDAMSMANGLEVRTPFLDYRVVEFACALPAAYKVNKQYRKMIVNDAFRKLLPPELYHRPKRGFEIPLHGFLTTELRSLIENTYLSRDFILWQQVFDIEAVDKLKRRLFSGSPGDSAARIWALIVFQHWWKKWME